MAKNKRTATIRIGAAYDEVTFHTASDIAPVDRSIMSRSMRDGFNTEASQIVTQMLGLKEWAGKRRERKMRYKNREQAYA